MTPEQIRELAMMLLDSSPNFQDASRQMKLTPQETNLYAHHLNELVRGGVLNNGKISTVYQTQFGVGDKEYNAPTVYDGKIINVDDAIKKAMENLDQWPAYKTPKEAEDRYSQMHDYMEKDLPEQDQ